MSCEFELKVSPSHDPQCYPPAVLGKCLPITATYQEGSVLTRTPARAQAYKRAPALDNLHLRLHLTSHRAPQAIARRIGQYVMQNRSLANLHDTRPHHEGHHTEL